jgi:hypothetical protein
MYMMIAYRFACMLLLTCVSQQLMAQMPKNPYQRFYVGLRGAPQLTWLLSEQDENVSRKLTFGYHGGLALGQYFRKHIAFETGILYSRQGQIFETTAPDSYFTLTVPEQSARLLFSQEHRVLDYLKIPAFVKYVSSQEKQLAFSSFGGIQIGFLTSASYRAGNIQPLTNLPGFLTSGDIGGGFVTLPDSIATGSSVVTYKDKYNPTTVSIVGGLGLDVRLTGNLLLSGHLRADYDMIDIEDRTLKPIGTASRANLTVGLQFGLSYVFGDAPTASTEATSAENAEPGRKSKKKAKADKKAEAVPEPEGSPAP